MTVVKTDVLAATVLLQLCAGLEGGCEAAVHTLAELFSDEDTDAVLFVDAFNAFNNLHRQGALYNQYLCPAVSRILINCYRVDQHLCR